jgi:hypothetical protein
MAKKLLLVLTIRINRRDAIRRLLAAAGGAIMAASVGRVDVFAITCDGSSCGGAFCHGSGCSGTDTCSCTPDFTFHGSTNCWASGLGQCCDYVVNCGFGDTRCYCAG